LDVLRSNAEDSDSLATQLMILARMSDSLSEFNEFLDEDPELTEAIGKTQ
jgi:hypothetical protein